MTLSMTNDEQIYDNKYPHRAKIPTHFPYIYIPTAVVIDLK